MLGLMNGAQNQLCLYWLGWKDGVLYKSWCRSKSCERGIAQLGIDTCYTNEDSIIALFNTIFKELDD